MIQTNHTDAIIARCLSGEQSAYSELYNAYAAGVYRLCYSLLLHQQDAEDIMQESFVYAFKNLHRFDANRAAFKTWLYTIAISRCRNTYRRNRSIFTELSQLILHSLPGPHSEKPEVAHAQTSAQDALTVALSALKPNLREAIVLRYGHDLTYREMGEILNCPPKTAESRVRLAHNILRGTLQQDGLALLEELQSV